MQHDLLTQRASRPLTPTRLARTARWRWLLALVLLLGGPGSAWAQVTKTLPGDYATFTAAITDINANFATGGVTVNVAAGYAETPAAALPLLTAQGTGGATGQIIFQKAGAGANPRITAPTGSTSTTVDGIIRLDGADFVTFDGIDLVENVANTTTATQMEFGYALFRPTTANGCQNNTIRNCFVGLNKINPATIGIAGLPHPSTATTAAAAASPAGANSNNVVSGNVVSNATKGIDFTASSATTTANYDQNNLVGVTAGGVAAGNTVGNFGSLGTSGWGAGGNYQNGLKIANNTINSTRNFASTDVSVFTAVAATTVTTTLRGIFGNAGVSANIDITDNTVTLASGAATNQMSGIENSIGSTAAGNTVNILRNTVTNCTYATATTGTFFGIANAASAATVNVSNNTVTNNTTAGTGSMTLVSGGSPNALNLNGNTISGNSKQAATTTAAITLSCLVAVNNAVTATGNTIANNTIVTSGTSSSTGTLFGYSNGGGPVSETLTGNTITGLGISGTSTSTANAVSGIRCNTGATDVQLFTLNVIGGLSIAGSGSGTVNGILFSLGGGAGSNIARNKIYDLSAGGTGGFVNGISISGGGTFPLNNNLIGDLRTPASTALLAVNGLSITGGTGVNAYFNTIYLAATSSSATTFGTSGIYVASATPVLDLRNNIVVNKSAPGATGGVAVAYRRSAAPTTANFLTSSNYNLYFAGTPGPARLLYVEGAGTLANAKETLADYKTYVAPREANSVTEDVAFASTTGPAATFLHIDPATPTKVESGGQTVAGLTTDFDGDTRGATPDIGADEGAFTPIQGVDAQLLSIDSPAPPFAAGSQAVVVTLRNAGTTAITSAVIDLLVNGVSQGTSPFSGNLAPGATASVTLNSFNFVAGTAYTITANITSANGGATETDLTNNSRTLGPVQVALCGNYNVGASGAYPTLDAAVTALNQGGASCAVTFTLTDAAYAASAGITLNQFPGNSSVNTLIIKPGAGVQPTLTTTATATFLLRLNGADYVTLDGSNSAGGTTRDLTLTTGNTATAATLVQLVSLGTGTGATNNTLRNLNVVGASTSLGIAIAAGGATPGTAGADNDNLVIQNNSVQKIFNGIYVGGSTATSAGGTDGLSITGNVVGAATTGAGDIGSNGLFIANAVAPTVSGNTVQNVAASGLANGLNFSTGVSGATVAQNLVTGVSAATSANAFGIVLGPGFVNGVVDRNRILNIVGALVGGYGGKGIEVNTGAAASNLRISNNFVAGLGGSGWTTLTSDAVVGIRLLGTTGGVSLYHNSVNLTGTTTRTSTSADVSAALYVASTVTALDVRNNIFANTIVSTTTGGAKAYAFYSSAPKTAYTAINHNDYFVSGSQGLLGNIGGSGLVLTGTDLPALADFQAATGTGQDANSVNVDPAFVSATDLHTSASGLNNAGTPLAAVTTDIDGQTRNATTPDIGADEFTPASLDLKPNALVAPAVTNCYSAAEPVTVQIQNNAAVSVDFSANNATVTVVVTPPSGAANNQTFTTTLTSGTLAAGATQNVTLPGTLNMTAVGAYSFAITATVAGDGNTGNDALTPAPTRTVAAPVAGTLSPTNFPLCNSGTATLTLTGSANGGIQFQSSPDNVTFTSIAGATSSPYTTPVLTQTTYFRALTSCNAAVATSNVATVTVNSPQVAGTNSPVSICEGSTATLTATASSGATVRFFDAATGGPALATSSPFTTPALTASRQYFVEAASGSTENVGPAGYTSTGQTPQVNGALFFTAAGPTAINSVTVFLNAGQAAGTVTIILRAGSSITGAIVNGQSTAFAVPAGPATGVAPYVVPLNYSVPTGGQYTLHLSTATQLGLLRDNVAPNITGFPYSSPSGAVSITAPSVGGFYYYFYNWQISTECASPTRTAIQVNVAPAPTFTTAPTDVACFGGSTGSITVTAAAGSGTFEYSSNGGTSYQASNVFGGLAAGTYSVLVRNLGGAQCPAAAAQSVTITQPASAVSFTTSQTNVSCFGGSTGSLTVTAAGGTVGSGYQYSNNNGSSYQASNVFSGLAAGTYQVLVRDGNACVAPAQAVTIAQPASAAAVTATKTDATTFGASDGTVTGTGNGGTGPYQYSLNGGAFAPASPTAGPFTFTGLTAGSYNVTVRDANACTATTSVVVGSPGACNAPSALAAGAITNTSASVSFTASASATSYTVTTSPATTTQSVTASPVSFTGLTPGTAYTVSIVSNCAGGQTSGPATVSFTTTTTCNAATALTPTGITTNAASVSFTGSSSATSYTVTTSPATTPQTLPAGASSVSFAGLTQGTAYTVSIVSNCAGGLTATATTTFTTAAPACNAPSALAAGSVTNTSATVSFTGSGTATGYTVTTSPATTTQTLAGSATSVSFAGLNPGVAYTVSIVSSCVGGVTSGPATVSFTTTATCNAATALTSAGVTSTSATVSFTGSASATSYTVTTSPVTTTQTLPAGASSVSFSGLSASTAYTVSIVSSCAGGLTATATTTFTTTAAPLTDLTVSTGQTISGAYNNVTVTGPNGVATLGGTLTVNGTLTVQAGAVLAQNCQALNGPGNFVLAAGAELQICDPAGISSSGATGAVQLAGSRSFSADASYTYNGTVLQITGAGLPAQVRNLTVNNGAGLNLTNALGVAQVLRLTSGDLNLGARDLTLLSGSAGTALVVNTGGVVLGTATVQRYIDPSLNPGLGYRHFSAPVANTTVADLTTFAYSPVVNGAYNTLGNTVSPFPTVFGYEQGRVTTSGNPGSQDFDRGFFSPTATTDLLATGRGYTVNITASALVDFRGTLNTGPVSMGPLARGTQTESGWQFLGNPYPSPLDWSTVAVPAGLNSAVYVFQSSSQYAGSYRSYQNGVGSGNPLIASAQGFFVRTATAGATPVLALTNANRVTTFNATNPTFNRGNDPRPLVQLTLNGATGAAALADPAYVYFEQGATAGVDARYDAFKIRNSGAAANLYALAGAEELSIAGLAPLASLDVVVPLGLTVPQAGAFVLNTADLRNFGPGTQVLLRDAQTGLLQDLSQQPRYPFAVAAGALTNTTRFALVFRPSKVTGVRAGLLAAQVDVYPNPAHKAFSLNIAAVPTAPAVRAVLYNALGQPVQERTLPVTATGVQARFDVSSLATGVYLLRITAGDAQVTKRVVVE